MKYSYMFTEYFKVFKARFLCIFESMFSLHIANAFFIVFKTKEKPKFILLNHRNSIQTLLENLSSNTMKTLISRTNNINKPLGNRL